MHGARGRCMYVYTYTDHLLLNRLTPVPVTSDTVKRGYYFECAPRVGYFRGDRR